MIRPTLAMAVAVVLGAAPAARAQSAGFHQHDGFFLQLNGGLGAMSSEASAGGTTMELSGSAGQFSLAIGGAVTENFVLAGEMFGVSVSSPDVTINGTNLGSADGADLGLSAIGLNLTYYFMPINIYVSATPAIGVLTATTGSASSSTDNGFAFKLAVGKEWWVSDNWGVGLNLQYAHSSNKDSGTNSPTWGTNWFGATFSASYN